MMNETRSPFVIFHVDDDPLETKQLARALSNHELQQDYIFYSSHTIQEFFSIIKNIIHVDLFILDLNLSQESRESGLSLVKEVRIRYPYCVVLMSSNADDPSSILKCLQAGADEFISKSTSKQELVERLSNLRQSALLKRGIETSINNHHKVLPFAGQMMKKISIRIPQIILSAISSVYIEGESGTGKEVVADLFKQAVNNIPFFKVNCGSLSETLLESELFGHVRGSFTGALTDKEGLIESASGGWVFLDEVGCLSDNAQIALLRTMENQEIIRIGESKARKVDVRYIAASNISLPKLVDKGCFRNDLWQRLCETEIQLLPLRDRNEEIPELILYFCEHMRGGPYKIDKTAFDILSSLPWSEGNIRELRNCLRAMTEHHNQGVLTPMGIPERILEKSNPNFYKNTENKIILTKNHSEIISQKAFENSSKDELNNEAIVQIELRDSENKDLSFNELTNLLLEKVIEFHKKKSDKLNYSQLAKTLQISRSTLHTKLKKKD